MEQGRAALAERLRVALDQRQITSGDLADATGVHPTTTSRWLRSDGPWPDAAQLVAIGAALGVSVDWLLGVEAPDALLGGVLLARQEIDRLADRLQVGIRPAAAGEAAPPPFSVLGAAAPRRSPAGPAAPETPTRPRTPRRTGRGE